LFQSEANGSRAHEPYAEHKPNLLQSEANAAHALKHSLGAANASVRVNHLLHLERKFISVLSMFHERCEPFASL